MTDFVVFLIVNYYKTLLQTIERLLLYQSFSNRICAICDALLDIAVGSTV